jgi:HNH endonuclease
MKEIPLTQGKVALVDDVDYPAVSQFKWHAQRAPNTFYALRKLPKVGGKSRRISLHRFLLGGVRRIDHRDGDGLNNRRENLRPATTSQNAWGRCRKRAGASSKYRGVCWETSLQRWRADIEIRGKKLNLGRFVYEVEAAKAYDTAARRYFGEFASPNFPLTS